MAVDNSTGKVKIILQGITKTISLITYNNLLQAHICPLPGDHQPGLDCLSDEQVLPLLLAMDPDTLLNCGRTSPRLYRLVCDQEIWRHLLRGVEFTEERLEELRLFGQGLFRIERTPQMMPEILKEAAKRLSRYTNVPSQVKVKVTIAIQKTWGTPQTFEVDGRNLKELTKMAEAVGATFTIAEVQAFTCHPLLSIFRLIAAHLAEQEESLSKMELKFVDLDDAETVELFLFLQQVSQDWSVVDLHLWCSFTEEGFWKILEKISENGNIGTFFVQSFGHHQRLGHEEAKKDVLKKVWRMTNKFVFFFDNGNYDFGGGKGADGEATWERLLELIFEA